MQNPFWCVNTVTITLLWLIYIARSWLCWNSHVKTYLYPSFFLNLI